MTKTLAVGRRRSYNAGMTEKRDTHLDGLRGIAAMAVVMSHVAATTWTPFLDNVPAPDTWHYVLWHLGAPAVDLFFVLSGFVVVRSIIDRRGDYVGFLMRRWVRLLPIAWLGVMAGLLARHFATPPPMGTSNLIHALSAPLTGMDIVGYATMTAPYTDASHLNPVLWSLFIEMQATLAMPLLAFIARRGPVAIGGLGFGGILLATLLTRTMYPLLFCGFVLGAGYAGSYRRVPDPKVPIAMLIVGMGLLLIRHWTGTEDDYQRLVGAFGGLAVIMAVRAGAGAKLLGSGPVQWLGAISYPLYALHFPIMVGGIVLLGGMIGTTWAAVAAIPVALLAATIARIAVDMPAVRLSRMVR